MERSYLLLTGALSGLVSVLTHAVLWSLVDVVRPRVAAANASIQQLDVPDILLHMLAATGLGVLFWVSWGLAALVDVTWRLRGVSFPGLRWLVLARPALLSIALARAMAAGASALNASPG